MKVVSRKVLDAATGESVRRVRDMVVGQEYVVLTVTARPGGEISLRVNDSEHSPRLWPSDLFETVSDRIPSCWTCEVRGDDILGDGIVELAPKAWQRPDFWLDYYDDVPSAVAEFEAARALILAEEP